VNDVLLWSVRAFIYETFAATARAPLAAHVARQFRLTTEEAEDMLRALHGRHAIFLEPGTTRIRMANPFSAILTPHEVVAGGQAYFANCAWDTFGIVAALNAADAEIQSVCAGTRSAVRLCIAAGEVESAGEVVHYLVPFQHWFDDLVHT
jgi:alkylmercury lyase-like protein